MTALAPYLTLPGTAADALRFYAGVFGGEVETHSYAEFGRDDGEPDAVAHGEVRGPVVVFASDAAHGEASVSIEGMVFALLGAGDAEASRAWFDALADGGTVVDALQTRPWGDVDGTVRDRFGLTWLIGYSPA